MHSQFVRCSAQNLAHLKTLSSMIESTHYHGSLRSLILVSIFIQTSLKKGRLSAFSLSLRRSTAEKGILFAVVCVVFCHFPKCVLVHIRIKGDVGAVKLV